MTHFAIAQRLFSGRPSSAFLLGSIAPDAVLVRGNDGEGKARSHLRTVAFDRPDWEGLRDFYYSSTETVAPADFHLFVRGYLAHIMADRLWGQFKMRVGGTDKAMRDILWREEGQYEFRLYRSAPWIGSLRQHVLSGPLYELPGLYTLDELERWRRQLFAWLQEPNNEPRIVNQFITEPAVENFLGKAVLEIRNWMKGLIAPPTGR